MSAGILATVSLAKETTWGTAVVPSKSLSVHPGDGLVANVNTKFPTGIKGTLARNNAGSYKGAATYEGEYEVDYIPGYAALLMLSAIGSVSTATEDGETIVYRHTFAEAAAKPSLTIEQNTDLVVNRFAGAIATGFRINVSADNSVVVTFPVKAKSRASATAITPAYETAQPLNFAGASVEIGGSAAPDIDNLQIEYSNNQEMRHALNGSHDPAVKFPRPSTLTLSFDLYMSADAATEYVAYLNKTVQSFKLTLEGDSVGVASKLSDILTVPAFVYTAARTPITEEHNLVQVTAEAQVDTVTGKLFTLEEINTLSSL